MHFEDFLSGMNLEPSLDNAKLFLIQKWIKAQREQGISSSTIKRRIAALSSLFSFYRDLGVINQNCFKAVEVLQGNVEHHSPILELDQLRQVYQYANDLSREDSYVSPTIKMLIFSGLRNEALTNLKVQNIDFNKSLICIHYDHTKVNYKHRTQVIPLPPGLLSELREHVTTHQLLQEDKLLFGLAGLPLQNKALNRLTDRISKEMGWTSEQRVTPHGYRATISTILSERGVDLYAIKFLLGHTEKDNLQFYIRRYSRNIQQLRRALIQLENELIQNPNEDHYQRAENTAEKSSEKREGGKTMFPRETLLKILESDPDLAIMMIKKGIEFV